MASDDLDFTAIHRTFRPRVLRYLERLLGPYEAEDLTQEVFAKVSQGLKGFRREASLSTWIYRIATNAALDRLRGRSSPGTLLQLRSTGAATRRGPAVQELPDRDVWKGTEAPSVELVSMREEMRDCIRHYVDRLPDRYRAVLLLSEVEELSDREIAEVLGLSLGAVKIRLHRARARLKHDLEAHCRLGPDERGEVACEPTDAAHKDVPGGSV